MAKVFYVVGGEYVDTTFQQLAPGQTETNLGPFTEKEALDAWRNLTSKSVDNAHVRYFVRHDSDHSSGNWLVVGGEYADTGFKKLAKGAVLSVLGPFQRDQAMDKWREMTGKTIDSAVTRFEIIGQGELEAFTTAVST